MIGGYDFVGERWPNSPLDANGNATLEPDPDPIGAPDATTFGGHGTHSAGVAKSEQAARAMLASHEETVARQAASPDKSKPTGRS